MGENAAERPDSGPDDVRLSNLRTPSVRREMFLERRERRAPSVRREMFIERYDRRALRQERHVDLGA